MGWKFNPFTGKLDISGGGASGPAGGDLTGTYPNPTVDGLQGNPVSNAAPTNGQVLQFDGTNWVPGAIPSGGSGGGGVVYFLNFNTAADAPVTNIPQTPNASKELAITAETTATSFTSAILPTASYAFLASFVTDLNVPSATAIPAGVWDFNLFAESTPSGAANHVYYKIEILKYDGVNAPVLLASSPDSYIYDPQDITQYVTSVVMPQTTILETDRLVVYLYGRATQNNKTITFYFGGSYPSHTHSTMPSVTGTGVVKVVNGVFQSPASTIVDSDVSASAAIGVSKLAMSTNRLLGRTTAGTGAVEEITVGTGLSLSAGTLSSTVTAGVTSVTATSPITSSGGTTPVISTSIATNRIVGRSTAGTGVMEELTPVGITVSGGNITGIGGTLGTVDNAVPRADGTGGYTAQGSNIVIDDVATATQDNVAIVNASSATNSSLVLTPKGTGALIAGPKPDGTATGGNSRGTRAVDLQRLRGAATQVASGSESVICGGQRNTSSGVDSAVVGGYQNNNGVNWGFIGGGYDNATQTNEGAAICAGYYNRASGSVSFIGGGGSVGYGNSATERDSAILGGAGGLADRRAMQAHSAGRFAANGDAQRARFVMRNKTTTNAAVELFLDGSATRLTIPSGKIFAFTINISGVKSDGSAVAHYLRQYCLKNVSGTTSQVYAPVTIGTDNAAGTLIALSANDTNDALRVEVTGITSEIWRWVASVDAVEIAFGI